MNRSVAILTIALALPAGAAASEPNWRIVSEQTHAGELIGLAAGDSLIFALPSPMAAYSATVVTVETGSVTTRITGSLVSAPGNFELLISNAMAAPLSAGEIRTPEGLVHVRAADGYLRLTRFDESAMRDCDVLPAPVGAPSAPASGSPRGLTTFDLLVAYTPASAAYMGSEALVRSLARSYVLSTNQYLADSLVPTRVRLVSLVATPYTENGTYLDNLYRLRDDDEGFMDELHPLRDVVGADLVALLADVSDVCGVAWLFGDNPDYGFSMTSIRCSSYTFAHELGHNLGCCHDRDNSGGGCYTPDSYGYRFDGNSGTQWRTIMAYSPGTRIGHFSNPNVNYDGQPTGTEDEYNAATIPLTSPQVDEYRAAAPFVDCDGNYIADAIDISTGAALDVNGDGIIDGCTTCAGDIDADSQIGLADLAILLSNFGQSGATAANGDLNGDTMIDLSDLAQMLALFGSTCG